MTVRFSAAVQWIKQEFGGRGTVPAEGLRPTIRFQRGVGEWLSGGRDVEIVRIEIDDACWSGIAEFRFANPSFEAEEKTRKYLREGELVELLDAYRVIGVGRIVAVID